MNRIDERFSHLRQQGKKGLIVYIGAGDPTLDATVEMALAFDREGVDVLELGVPFSDPLADGLVNQLAAQRGLESGTTPPKVLEAVARIRQSSQIPIVLYIYYNLLHRVGIEFFIHAAARAGVDGLLVLDLPPEEADEYQRLTAANGICAIWLIAPTTPAERVARIVSRASGFVYYVSREGVTGMQQTISGTIGEMTTRIRRHTHLPIAIGFGISNAEQARQVAVHGEAIVVGSAIVTRIAENKDSPELITTVAGFVREINTALKEQHSRPRDRM